MTARSIAERETAIRRRARSLEWLREAACTGMDTEIFYSVDGDSQDTAMATCLTCPVRRECLEHAIATEPSGSKLLVHGIRGGARPQDRIRIRNERKRAAEKARAS